MRPHLPESVLSQKVIPVARGLDAKRALNLADGLLAGGLSTIEVTIEEEGGVEAIAALQGGPMTIGAGTVTSIAQAVSAVAAGATFLVCPHFDSALVEWSIEKWVPLVPGGFTPTEVSNAWSSLVPAVKVFPAFVGGPAFIRSLLGPYPDVQLIPTGGIDGENTGSYLAAGAVAVGVGGWLTGHDDMSIVEARAIQLRNAVAST